MQSAARRYRLILCLKRALFLFFTSVIFSSTDEKVEPVELLELFLCDMEVGSMM
jgi:hypothetical protein